MRKIKGIFGLSCFLLFTILLFGFGGMETFAKSHNEFVILAKSSKKVKRETIHSKKALIKSLEKHLTKMDKKFSYRINKKIVKNLPEFEKIFFDTKNKKFLPSAIISQIDYYDYSSSSTRDFFELNLDIKYRLSKKQLKKFASEMRKLEKSPALKAENEVKEAFFEKFLDLERNYSVKVSKNIARAYHHNIDNFFASLEDEPRFNDLKWHMQILGEIRDYSSFSMLNFSIKHFKSEKELKEIISKITPVLNTKQEVFAAILEKAEAIENNYSINIKNDALGYQIDKGNQFWDDLYDIPEYNDLSHHNEDGSYEIEEYKGYFKFRKFDKFSIRKEEVENLKTFVKTWVSTNIKAGMAEEEKVRAINDFMVKEYRYTYGNRGQLSGKEEGKEKLGKYSVYSCFALIDGKGGVCNAKANMFYRLAKEAGLEVLYVTGDVDTGLHAWNMVKVDGNWYHLDNTWNRGQYEGSSEYDYFNTRDYYLKSDNTMRKNHSWDDTKYPVAPMDYQGYVPTASTGIPILNKVA